CRTRHAFLGEYYAKFVPTEPIQCPCGARTQTRDHIIQTCEIYDDYRDLLWNVSDDLDIGEILGTEEGIEALAEFIEKSGAFKKTGQLTPEITEPRLDDATVEGGNEADWEEEDGRIAEEASDDDE
ncbi:hypothetical protein EV359DRAFT_27801, partial [Lentinula novae-zelandiae]